jgi:hypothetical protein
METLKLPDVIMAILDCRSRFPQAMSAALIREHEDDDVFVYIVLLDDKRQPISVEPGTITAATYVARHLGEDLVAAFGGKKAIILKLGPAEWGAGRARPRPATTSRSAGCRSCRRRGRSCRSGTIRWPAVAGVRGLASRMCASSGITWPCGSAR